MIVFIVLELKQEKDDVGGFLHYVILLESEYLL